MNIDFEWPSEDPAERVAFLESVQMALPGSLEDAAHDIGARVIATASRLVRVDTGRLRASLAWEVEDVGLYAIGTVLGSNVEYSEYVEADYPFLRPAIRQESGYIERRIREAESQAWEDAR